MRKLTEYKSTLDGINLEKEKETFISREKAMFEESIEQVKSTEKTEKTEKTDLDQEIYEETIKIKRSLKAIKQDQVLYGYYSGFMFTFYVSMLYHFRSYQ